MWLNKFTQIKKLKYFLLSSFFAFTLFATSVSAAPNIISQNLTGIGTFTPGQVITFSANTTNIGTEMNTTNSHRLQLVRNLTQQAGVYDFLIKGNYLYTFGYSVRQLHIYDISNLDNPVLVTTYALPSGIYATSPYVYEIETYGNYLILGGSNVYDYDEVAIYDISNPTSPVFVSSINTRAANGWDSVVGTLWDCHINYIDGMQVMGNWLYVSGGAANSTGYTNNFCSYDLSNPANATFGSDINNDGWANEFVASGGNVYLLIKPTPNTTFRGIRTINISNPSAMYITGQMALPSLAGTGRQHSVLINGNLLYVGGTGSADLSIVDASNPSSLQVVSQIDFGTINTNWIAGVGFSLQFPYLHILNTAGLVGVNVVDVSNPATPVLKGHTNGAGGNVSWSNNSHVLSSGYAATGISIFKPKVRSQFCIDNPNCATSSGGGIGTRTFDSLGAGATVATSTTWTATLGTHTIYYCSDIVEQYSFDGVSESNESDNCSSYTFVVSNPTPPTAIVEAQVNGGTWSAASVTVNPSDILNIRWSSTNATACTGTGIGFSTGNAVSGTDTTITTPSPGTTGSYAVTCTGTGGTGGYTLPVTVRQRPNFTTPIFSSPSFGAFNGITGAYGSLTITMQTSNNGGSASLVNAPYEILVNGVIRSTGIIAPLGAGGFSNQTLVVPGPIPIGTVVVQSEIDKGNAVAETNELDNIGNVSLSVLAANPGISLTVVPAQVQNNQSVTISWNVANPYPMNCSVFGPNLATVTFDPAVNGAAGNATAGPITAKSMYTISCNVAGTVYTQTGTVETQGIFEEV